MKKEKTSRETHFAAARRDSDDTLSEFKDSNGRAYDHKQALEAVERGMIENALLFTERDRARHICGINDGGESTSLRNLKEF